MKNIYCKHCDKYVDLKSNKCPLCGYQFSLKEIIPDHEVEQMRKNTLSALRKMMITQGIIIVLLLLLGLIPFIGIIFVIIAIFCIIGLIKDYNKYNKYSNLDFEEWRKEVGKNWKYLSGTEKAFNVLKIANELIEKL